MKLYMHPFSQHCRRVLMLCQELALDVECALVALDRGEHKTENYLRLSRTGRIPLLVDGDFRLAESHAIMRYLVSQAGKQAFYPIEAKARAHVDMWLDWNHTQLNPPIQTVAIQRIIMKDKADQALIAAAQQQAGEALDTLERALSSGDSIGGAVTLADFSLASTIALYEMVGGSASSHRAVSKWLDGIKRRPSFQRTAPAMA